MRSCFTLGVPSRQADFERGAHKPQIGCEAVKERAALWGSPVQSLSTPVEKIGSSRASPGNENNQGYKPAPG